MDKIHQPVWFRFEENQMSHHFRKPQLTIICILTNDTTTVVNYECIVSLYRIERFKNYYSQSYIMNTFPANYYSEISLLDDIHYINIFAHTCCRVFCGSTLLFITSHNMYINACMHGNVIQKIHLHTTI